MSSSVEDADLQSLPVDVRLHIRDFFLAVQIPVLVTKLLEDLWVELVFQNRNVRGWNLLMQPHYKIKTRTLLTFFYGHEKAFGRLYAKRKLSTFLVKFTADRFEYAERNTPAWYEGFSRPRHKPLNDILLKLYRAVISPSVPVR
jgi:hypothetical protein